MVVEEVWKECVTGTASGRMMSEKGWELGEGGGLLGRSRVGWVGRLKGMTGGGKGRDRERKEGGREGEVGWGTHTNLKRNGRNGAGKGREGDEGVREESEGREGRESESKEWGKGRKKRMEGDLKNGKRERNSEENVDDGGGEGVGDRGRGCDSRWTRAHHKYWLWM